MNKFVFTGSARSGTTVVSGSIVTHPNILFYGELLNDTIEVRKTEAARITMGAGWKISDKPLQPLRPCQVNEDGGEYLKAFYAMQSNAGALGFKLLYDQVSTGANSSAWQYLAENPDIKVVATQRSNLLEVVCSYAKAMQSRVWHQQQQQQNIKAVELAPAQCEEWFERFSYVPDAIKTMQQTHDFFIAEYEDINKSFTATMNDIFKFLDIAPFECKPLLQKIAKQTPKQELANYSELKQHFAGTQYEQYFIY